MSRWLPNNTGRFLRLIVTYDRVRYSDRDRHRTEFTQDMTGCAFLERLREETGRSGAADPTSHVGPPAGMAWSSSTSPDGESVMNVVDEWAPDGQKCTPVVDFLGWSRDGGQAFAALGVGAARLRGATPSSHRTR